MTTDKNGGQRAASLPSVRRLPLYLNELQRLRAAGRAVISAAALAEMTGQIAPVVKKDIAITGVAGKTGVGYEVDSLIRSIREYVGWHLPCPAVLAGLGSLGTAIISHEGFRAQNLHIVAAFDVDPAKAGKTIHGVPVRFIEELEGTAAVHGVRTGILTVPSEQAQEVADRFVLAGITRIWSFAERALSVPSEVTVQREVLSSGLAELLVRSSCRTDVEEAETAAP